ncbi:MAG: hypothetical protein HYV63_28785 [Candidatus Schekmanbacteria bacterium]|nr:hypothetical protein [Candidatus Schekmanbacteria bacterium]
MDLVFGRKIDRVIVEYRDRLARFGYDYLERTFGAFDVRVEVLEAEKKEHTEELADDLLAIIRSFAARLYGARGGNAIKKWQRIYWRGSFHRRISTIARSTTEFVFGTRRCR